MSPAAPPAAAGPRRRPRPLLPLALLLLFLAPFLVPLPPELSRSHALDLVLDLSHTALLGGLAWVLYLRGPCAGRAWRAAAAALGVGVLIEVLQSWVGRSMSLHDVQLDAVGIGVVLAVLRWRETRAPLWLAPAAALLALIGWKLAFAGTVWIAEREARARFPLLADFEPPRAMLLWHSGYGSRLRLVEREDGRGRALAVTGGPPQTYPGATLGGFPWDWSRYRRVEWDARVVGPDSLDFMVRLDDLRSRRDAVWIGERFTARPAWRHYAWVMDGCFGRPTERPFRLDDAESLTFCFAHPAAPVTLEIDNVRLTE